MSSLSEEEVEPVPQENYANVFTILTSMVKFIVSSIKLIISFIKNIKVIFTWLFWGFIAIIPIYVLLQIMKMLTWMKRDKLAKKSNQMINMTNRKMDMLLNMTKNSMNRNNMNRFR